MSNQLARETRTRVYPVFIWAAVGFAIGWLGFSLSHPHVEVLPYGMQYTNEPLCNGGLCPRDPWAPSATPSWGPSPTSVTKVDNLDATHEVLARDDLRITSPTGPTITSGAAVPSSVQPAGSVYFRTNGTEYTNTNGTGVGWTVLYQSGTFPTSTCGAGTATTSIANTGAASCSTFVNAAGDHLSLTGSTLSLAQVVTASFLGRTTAGTGNVETLTATQATALLNTVTIAAKGLAPTLPNDATRYLDGTGAYSVPAGTGVSSITAGQSISVTGAPTTPTVALNFPTTACSAGQAVTSSSSAGTPSCSTFFNTAGTSLSNTGSTVNLNFPTTACTAGQAVTSHASSGAPSCSTFVNAAGDHLSLTGSTLSLAQVVTASFLGRTTAGTGNVETLTATQATALLNTVTIAAKGLVPTLPNDATRYLDGTGAYSVPAGTGVSSITAGQSITVTGTTTPTVALNFPTTACTAGQAVTSHTSAGTPSCSTFVNAAGTGLALTSSSLAVSIAGASCAAGQFVSAISATGTGTCTAPSASGGDPGFYMVPGEGTCAFDGVANPVCGASLSGSTYDAGRDIAATTMSVTSGKRLKMRNYRVYVQGALTVDGTIDVNGGNASGGSGGGKQDVNNTCGAGTNGGAAQGAGINAPNYIPYGLFPLDTTSAASTGGGNGANGPAAGRGGGGGGSVVLTVGTSNGATSGTMNGGGTFSVDSAQLFGCKAPDGSYWSGGTGGGGGGQAIQGGSSCTAGGGGAGGGWLPIQAGSLAGTGGVIAADGGNGANGSGLVGTLAGCGGGGGGGGGIVSLRFGSYSGSVTVHANGGTPGTGVVVGAGSTAASGGTGANGKVTCVNTGGGTSKPTGCP